MAVGSDFWWDFQLMAGRGCGAGGACRHDGDRDSGRAGTLGSHDRHIAPWQSPNYDCWEEHRERVHVSTLAALYGG